MAGGGQAHGARDKESPDAYKTLYRAHAKEMDEQE